MRMHCAPGGEEMNENTDEGVEAGVESGMNDERSSEGLVVEDGDAEDEMNENTDDVGSVLLVVNSIGCY